MINLAVTATENDRLHGLAHYKSLAAQIEAAVQRTCPGYTHSFDDIDTALSMINKDTNDINNDGNVNNSHEITADGVSVSSLLGGASIVGLGLDLVHGVDLFDVRRRFPVVHAPSAEELEQEQEPESEPTLLSLPVSASASVSASVDMDRSVAEVMEQLTRRSADFSVSSSVRVGAGADVDVGVDAIADAGEMVSAHNVVRTQLEEWLGLGTSSSSNAAPAVKEEQEVEEDASEEVLQKSLSVLSAGSEPLGTHAEAEAEAEADTRMDTQSPTEEQEQEQARTTIRADMLLQLHSEEQWLEQAIWQRLESLRRGEANASSSSSVPASLEGE